MRATTRGKTPNPMRMRDFARFTFCDDEIFARHRSPCDIRSTRATPAIDAMTIDQSNRPTLQHISCPAANASTSDLHKFVLAHFNCELTRMNTNCCGPPEAGRPTAASFRESKSSRRHLVFKLSCRTFFCRFRTLLAIVAR